MAEGAFQYDPKGHSQQLYHSKRRLMNWVHGAHIREALARMPLGPGLILLDAGCSDGELLSRAGENYAFAVGADHNIQALQTLSQRLSNSPKTVCLQGDARTLPFRDGSFDAVCCLETLEHVNGEQQAIAELKRILKDDGTLIVSVPIEIGLSVLLKQGAATLFYGGYRGSYAWTELWNAFRGNLDHIERPNFSSHKGFDYRKTLAELRRNFADVQTAGLPMKWLGGFLNTQFLMAARGKIGRR
ncbi:MAG: class I SAM-dependent methyltransferase [Candidatus Omnitrophota bacterium]